MVVSESASFLPLKRYQHQLLTQPTNPKTNLGMAAFGNDAQVGVEG